MKLIALECPKCNAQLEINEELSHATCNYCGCHFLIDDELKRKKASSEDAYKMGYDFERGRYERQVEECRKLANQVQELIDPILDLKMKKNKLKCLSTQIRDLKIQESTSVSFKGKIASFKALIYILFFTMCFAGLGGGFGVFAIGLLAAVISFFCIRFKRKKEQSGISELIRQKNAEYIDTESEIFFISKEYNIDLIPPQYCNREAMEYISEVLYNQRAMNIPQAINLYEDKLYKMRMEMLHREQIALQKEQQKQAARKEAEQQNGSSSGWGSLLKAGGTLMALVALVNTMKDD